MKKLLLAVTVVLLQAGIIFSQYDQNEFPVLKGPYLGQKTPGLTPEIFAPGIISVPNSVEYSGTFSPDCNEFYFYRFTKNTKAAIYYTRIADGQWTKPQVAAFAEGYPSYEPHMTFDNKALYFAWEYPLPEGEVGISGIPGIWVTSRTANGWSVPEYAGQGMFVSSGWDGQLYITDLLHKSGGQLAQVIVNNGHFTAYKKLTGGMDSLRDKKDIAHPCIAPDGSYLLFDTEGGRYLYICFKIQDRSWGEAIDLTKHGLDPMAGGAFISPDGKYLFFHLKGDIWWVSTKIIEDLRPE